MQIYISQPWQNEQTNTNMTVNIKSIQWMSPYERGAQTVIHIKLIYYYLSFYYLTDIVLYSAATLRFARPNHNLWIPSFGSAPQSLVILYVAWARL